jgi:hypothetical protein
MRWPLVRPGKIDAFAVLQGNEGRLMATSENVGSVSDMRLAAATEEIDQVSRLHRRGIGVGSILRVPCDGITGPQMHMPWHGKWQSVDGDRVLHELLTSQRAKLIDRCRLEVARSTLYATGRWRSLRQRPTRRPRFAGAACTRRESIGGARQGYPLRLLQRVQHSGALGPHERRPMASFDKTSQAVTNAMFKRIGSQASRA